MLQNLRLVNQTLFVACILLVIGVIGLISQRRPGRVLVSLGVMVAGVLLVIGGMNSLTAGSSVHLVGWAVLILFAVYASIGGSLVHSAQSVSESTQDTAILTLDGTNNRAESDQLSPVDGTDRVEATSGHSATNDTAESDEDSPRNASDEDA